MCRRAGSFGVLQQKDLYSVFYIFSISSSQFLLLVGIFPCLFLPFSFSRVFTSLFVILLFSSSTRLKYALLVVFVSFLLSTWICVPSTAPEPTEEFSWSQASSPRSRRFSCSPCPKSECLAARLDLSSGFPANPAHPPPCNALSMHQVLSG